MFRCHGCGSTSAKSDFVSEVFTIDGRRMLVEHIPAQVCSVAAKQPFRVRRPNKSVAWFMDRVGRPRQYLALLKSSRMEKGSKLGWPQFVDVVGQAQQERLFALSR